MNIDPNIQKFIALLLRKWRLLTAFALIGMTVALIYTANFTTETFSSSVTFLAYAEDTRQEFSDSQSTNQQITSNTSKMNYALKMMGTYIELFKTYEFNQGVASELNKKNHTSYTASQIKNSISFKTMEDTAVFRVTVTTDNPDLSYQIARQLEESIPEKCKNTNNGLVSASVEDSALKATTAHSYGYGKKGLIGFAAGLLLAAAYVILRDLLDIRIKGAADLAEHYDIPVLGAIPEFDFRAPSESKKSQSNQKKASDDKQKAIKE